MMPDSRVLAKARDNAKAAGVAHLITFKQADVTALENPLPCRPKGGAPGGHAHL